MRFWLSPGVSGGIAVGGGTIGTPGSFFSLVQETLRGPALAALPFFDRAKVVALLDGLPAMDEGARTAYDPVVTTVLSACALQERYGL